MSTTAPSTFKYLGFANARLPDSDYRIGYLRESALAEVHLALPQRPTALPENRFIRLGVGEGLSLRSLIELSRVPWLLRKGSFDVAHFYASQYVLAGPTLARLVGVPSVVTVTGTGRVFEGTSLRHRVAQSVYRGLFKLSTRFSSAVLFQNSADMERMRAMVSSYVGSKFHLIGSAIDSGLFQDSLLSHSRVNAASEPPIVLMVARLQRAKGVDDFLLAAERLRGRCRFVLIGPPGRGEDELLAAVQKASTDGVLDYRGGLSDAQVRTAYAECDLVVLPSRTEGLPRVALEAAMSWRPVIAYDIPACRSALPSSSLVASFDLDGLVAGIDRLAADAAVRSTLAKEAHDWVAKRFSLKRYTRDLDALLCRVIDPAVDLHDCGAPTQGDGTK